MAKCEKCGKSYLTRECLNCRDNPEKTIKFTPPKPQQKRNNKTVENTHTDYSNKKHANFTIRLVATLIDTIIIGIPAYLFVHNYLVDALMAIIVIFLWIAWKGQSVGKKLVNIKIVTQDYKDICTQTAIIRYVGYYISAIILLAGYAIVPFRKDKTALHDMMASTYVIHTDKEALEIESDTADKVMAIVSIFIGMFLIIVTAANYQQEKEIKKFENKLMKGIHTINQGHDKMLQKVNKGFK